MHFKSFKGRILVFFLGLLLGALISSHILVHVVTSNNTRLQIEEDLNKGARIFSQLMNVRERKLLDYTRLLSGDYAFKVAYGTHDRDTILSALANHRARIGADMMSLVSLDGRIIADTLYLNDSAHHFEFLNLIKKAEESGESHAIVTRNGITYQIVIVPLLAPIPMAWIATGFLVDDSLAADLNELTDLEVTFILQAKKNKSKIVIASTLPKALQQKIQELISDEPQEGSPRMINWVLNLIPSLIADSGKRNTKTILLPLESDYYVTLVLPIEEYPGEVQMNAILQRSLTEEFKSYNRLRITLFFIAVAAVLGSVVLAVFLAKSVSRPVSILVKGVKRIETGDYTHFLALDQHDEMRILADAINKMTKGLAERRRVRLLLGKVVSPAIAEELLKKEVELGGEEREVTILFSDIRNFTSYAEKHEAHEVLSFLNIYLTRMSEVIERHGGVVDKYIGDSIMALFGAPLQHNDDADRALRTALDMLKALEQMNIEMERDGKPALAIGIGINTGLVVAGNMGSESRLNYTVIGDEVNLASRLERLTKEAQYKASIIVSESTLVRAKAPYTVRLLGEVAVKGKSKVTTIYALLGEKATIV